MAFTPEDLAEFNSAFTQVDLDANGLIGVQDVESIIRAVKPDAAEKGISKVIKRVRKMIGKGQIENENSIPFAAFMHAMTVVSFGKAAAKQANFVLHPENARVQPPPHTMGPLVLPDPFADPVGGGAPFAAGAAALPGPSAEEVAASDPFASPHPVGPGPDPFAASPFQAGDALVPPQPVGPGAVVSFGPTPGMPEFGQTPGIATPGFAEMPPPNSEVFAFPQMNSAEFRAQARAIEAANRMKEKEDVAIQMAVAMSVSENAAAAAGHLEAKDKESTALSLALAMSASEVPDDNTLESTNAALKAMLMARDVRQAMNDAPSLAAVSEESIDSLELENQTLREKLSKKKHKIKDLKHDLKAAESEVDRLNALQDELNAAVAEIERLKSKDPLAEGAVKELQTRMKEQYDRAEGLEKRLEESDGMVQRMKTLLDKSSKDQENLSSAIQTVTEQTAAIRSKDETIEDLRAQLAAATQQAADADAQFRKLGAQVNTDFERSQAEIHQLRAQLQASRQAQEAAEADLQKQTLDRQLVARASDDARVASEG